MKFLLAFFLSLVMLLGFACALRAEDKKPELTEAQESKGLALFQHALLLQTQAFQAQQAYQAGVKVYNDWAETTVKELKLPAGTTLQPNIDLQKVAIVPPPPKPEAPKTGEKK
jgi:hypothetical protein